MENINRSNITIHQGDVEVDNHIDGQLDMWFEIWFDALQRFNIQIEEDEWINLFAEYNVFTEELHVYYIIDSPVLPHDLTEVVLSDYEREEILYVIERDIRMTENQTPIEFYKTITEDN